MKRSKRWSCSKGSWALQYLLDVRNVVEAGCPGSWRKNLICLVCFCSPLCLSFQIIVDDDDSKVWSLYDAGPRSIRCPLIFLPPVSGTADVFFQQILALTGWGYRVIAVSILSPMSRVHVLVLAARIRGWVMKVNLILTEGTHQKLILSRTLEYAAWRSRLKSAVPSQQHWPRASCVPIIKSSLCFLPCVPWTPVISAPVGFLLAMRQAHGLDQGFCVCLGDGG